MESKRKNIINIMVDTMIYDKMYENKQIQQKFIEYIESGLFKFCSTDIQETQIRVNPKPGDKDKIEWSLKLHMRADIIPSLFSFDVEGAGYDQGRPATPEEGALYSKIKPNSLASRHHTDRNIAVVANAGVDVFVTDDIILRNGIKTTLSNLKIMNWDEFVVYIDKGKFDCLPPSMSKTSLAVK